MSKFEEFMNKFSPKEQKEIKVASEVETIRLPLASRGLTFALGGGIGRGRITLVYGNQSSGKTMLALQSIAQWQKQGLVCAFIDAEKAFDANFAEKLGVNTDELIVYNECSQATVTDIFDTLLRHEIDVVVLDSISDIAPNQFIDKDGGMKESENTKQIGAHSKAIKSMIDHIHYSNKSTAVILLSQTTSEIGQTYVKQVPHGGKKPLFASSSIIKLTSSATDAKQIKGEHYEGNVLVERPIGRHVEAVVEKNKLGLQNSTAEYDIYYGGDTLGIDQAGELLDMCLRYGVIEKPNNVTHQYGDITWRGKRAAIEAIRSDADLEKRLEEDLRKESGGQEE